MALPYSTTEYIDYLQRTREEDRPAPLPRGTTPSSMSIGRAVMWHITEIGRLEKRQKLIEDPRKRMPSEDMLTGLYGFALPIAFLLRGTPGQVAVHLGTWSPSDLQPVLKTPPMIQAEILLSSLRSLYPSVTVSQSTPDLSGLPLCGLALGIPTAKPRDPDDGALMIDRLIRALSGSNWACMVLAEPVKEKDTSDLRRKVIDELRSAEEAKLSRAPESLINHYSELLQIALITLTAGLAVGMWRTGVYLLGDEQSYSRLASLWRGVFSGDDSILEPIRVWRDEGAASMAMGWNLPPNTLDKPAPGRFKHKWEYQTLLTSEQLSAYIHLPEVETSGFAIRAVPDFDAVPPPVTDQPSVSIGEILLRSEPTRNDYTIDHNRLNGHAFVAGITGAGKTNSIFHVLKQLGKSLPFLVIEPAKREYRALLDYQEFMNPLHIFTLGDERVSKFRLNPFEVVGYPETSVGVHLDLLRSVFTASFGMWTPLPQILEQCLHRIYTDRGWDIITNDNPRLENGSDPSAAYPTLTDLAAKVDEVVSELGYDEKITSDMRAALLTRINSLRTGGKGRMLDVQRSLPMSLLLEHPTILELEGMGDDDDKAFVMGLLFIRLVEHRRIAGLSKNLQHLLVIEEAHRLLSNTSPKMTAEEGNPRGKAVETFTNLLAEIRAYGQGMLIADQIPVKLAPEAIKNTNLKIVHRTVAADDRAVLAGAMATNERQSQSLATLKNLEAVVFSDGDDAPIVVKTPFVKISEIQADNSERTGDTPDDASVKAYMSSIARLAPFQALFRPLQRESDVAVEDGPIWEVGRRILEAPDFQRFFARLALSIIEDPQAVVRLWPELLDKVRARQPPKTDEAKLLRCVIALAAAWFSQRRGAQNSWMYTAINEFTRRLERLLLEQLSGIASSQSRGEFQRLARQLHERSSNPFPACSRICRQQPRVCLYRYAATDLLATGRYREEWRATSGEGDDAQAWQVCIDVGEELIEFAADDWSEEQREAADAAARRASLCVGQLFVFTESTGLRRLDELAISNLIVEAAHE